MEACYTR